ncbi:MAG: hypothetical protein GY713_06735 [Actinomycetia bacterium]|nr:hypothetical protein [Actinomycetes bacterium]
MTTPERSALNTRHQPAVGAALMALIRLFASTVATRTRLLVLGLLGALGVLIAVLIRLNNDVSLVDGVDLVNGLGLSILLPLTALVLGAATFGDLRDDGTLVYLWLRPAPRWIPVVAAFLTTVGVVVPLVGVPLMAMAAITTSSNSDALIGTALSTAVGAAAYSALFVALGLRVRRHLVWGIGYILIWEGFIAGAGTNAARLAVRSHTRSLLAWATDVDLGLADSSLVAALLIPLGATVLALTYATRRFTRSDID